MKKTTGTLKVTAPETSYSCVRGADDTWKKGSGKTLTFIYKRSWKDEETIDHFTGILVDGKDVDKSCYTAVSGSVKITLNASYLETLSAGKHTFEALFDDAATEAVTFNILDNGSSNGKTGDENTPGIWIGIFLAAGAIFAGLLVIRLKKRKRS